MADLVKREDIFQETIKYLTVELERHITDEMTAKGKVQEAQELLNRLEQTCYLCGRHVPNYRSVDIAAHIEQEHPGILYDSETGEIQVAQAD